MPFKSLFLLLLATLLAFASPAFATGTGISFDTTSAVAGLVAMGTALGLVGAAKMAPAAIAVGWKWIKAMIFG